MTLENPYINYCTGLMRYWKTTLMFSVECRIILALSFWQFGCKHMSKTQSGGSVPQVVEEGVN